MTEHFEDLYGMKDSDGASLDYFSSLIGEAVGLKFRLRESSFVGFYFVAYREDEIAIRIQYNVDVLEDHEPLYPEFAEFKFLITANIQGREDADALRDNLLQVPNVTFLQRKT